MPVSPLALQIAATLALALAPAHLRSAAFISVQELLSSCEAEPPLERYCLGYLQGAGDMMRVAQALHRDLDLGACLPSGVSDREMKAAFVTWSLNASSEEFDTPAIIAVLDALRNAFPCPADTP